MKSFLFLACASLPEHEIFFQILRNLRLGQPKHLLSAGQHVAFLSNLIVELPGATAFVESLTDGLVVAALEALRAAVQACYAICPSDSSRWGRRGP